MYRICVRPNGRVGNDGERQGLLHDARSLGIGALAAVHTTTLYFLDGDLTPQQIGLLCAQLFVDPVTETAEWQAVTESHDAGPRRDGVWVVEVGLHPGVTDPVANQIVAMAAKLGMPHVQAATGKRFELSGDLDEAAVHTIARRLLCNPTIQNYYLGPMPPAFPQPARASHLAHPVPLAGLTDDELASLSRQRLLALNVDEMRAVRAYFAAAGRVPTDVELETLAQTWSEHCVHKTFRALIEMSDGSGATQRVDGLLRSYIRAATERVRKPWVRSAFVDNAGVIEFDEQFDVSFKVETHNHPSALEPFGGANTGVGGVVRDVIGVSARPIAVTDVLCFGPQDLPVDQVPEGTLHPRRIKTGVVAGIQDYGNKLGLPTVSGAILYDEGFTANPLVFAGCLGLAPIGSHPAGPRVGDLVIVIGGRTGRDGLHGATFSSESLTHETGQVAGTAVQIGDPIVEKDVIEVVCLARDAGLYSGITDCGAGGLSSAVGELGRELGVDVELADVPLKYPGLLPWEIWLSEAQERMVLAVPQSTWPALRALCGDWNVSATQIGRFTGEHRLVVRSDGKVVADLDMDFLHNGIPRKNLKTSRPPRPDVSPDFPVPSDLGGALRSMLARQNIASFEFISTQYDHEVQANSALKPLHGPGRVNALASVIRPVLDSKKGVVLSQGLYPSYSEIDPYRMAACSIDTAVRNAVSAGGSLKRLALLDNFCWCDSDNPERLWQLREAAQACYDYAVAYGTPFISGKDSMFNDFAGFAPGGTPVAISVPPTILISSLGIVEDVARCVSADFKAPGDLVYLLGATRAELGGSEFLAWWGAARRGRPYLGSVVPVPSARSASLYRAYERAAAGGLVTSAEAPGLGGLGAALARQAIAGGLGCAVDLAALPEAKRLNDAELLFSETPGRILCTVAPEARAAFEECLRGEEAVYVGRVTEDAEVAVTHGAAPVVRAGVAQLAEAYRRTFEGF